MLHSCWGLGTRARSYMYPLEAHEQRIATPLHPQYGVPNRVCHGNGEGVERRYARIMA